MICLERGYLQMRSHRIRVGPESKTSVLRRRRPETWGQDHTVTAETGVGEARKGASLEPGASVANASIPDLQPPEP